MKILIYTHPKSGSTLLSNTLATILPDYLEVFEPAKIEKPEWNNMIVKYFTNKIDYEMSLFNDFEVVLVLVRHPLDSLISHIMYWPGQIKEFILDKFACRYVNALEDLEQDVDGSSVKALWDILGECDPPLQMAFARGLQNITSASKHSKVVVVKYEDICLGNFDQIRDIIGDNRLVNLNVSPRYKRVERKKKPDDWTNWFSVSDLEFFLAQPWLRAYADCFGYNFINGAKNRDRNKKYGSGYVTAIMNELRQDYSVPAYEKHNKYQDTPETLVTAIVARKHYINIGTAFECSLEAMIRYPENAAVLFEVAKNCVSNGYDTAAKSALSKSLEYFYNNSHAWHLLADVEYRLGNLDDAIVASEHALKIRPESADNLNLLGFILLKKGKYLAAVDYLECAIHLDSSVGRFHWNLCHAYWELGRYSEALESLEKSKIGVEVGNDFKNLKNTLISAINKQSTS